jgi:hypothetical protein
MANTPERAGLQPLGHSGAVLVAILLVCAGITPALMIPLGRVAYAVSPPLYTSSFYEQTPYASTYYNEGCGQGDYSTPGIIVLDFGQPSYQSGQGYGTILFSSLQFVSTSTIAGLTENFLNGYWDCSAVSTSVTIGIGTSNDFGWTNYSHGATWAQMVNQVGSWIQSKGYGSKEAIAGADDIQNDWNGSSDPQDQSNIGPTTNWVNGFNTYYSYAYFDYGDAGGCPPLSQGQTCNNGWTYENIWFDSWGSPPALPLPEIYAQGSANEWQQISLYGYLYQGGAVTMQGSYTQYQACHTQGHGPCPGADNSPGEGWTQLYDALNADSRTAQGLPFSTDVAWNN